MVKYIPIKVPGKHPQTSELTTFELKGQHIELEEVVLIQAIKVFHQIPADGPLDGDHLRGCTSSAPHWSGRSGYRDWGRWHPG